MLSLAFERKALHSPMPLFKVRKIASSLPGHFADAAKGRLPIMVAACAFVILVCASLIFVEGWLTWRARTVQLAESKVTSANLAEAVAQHAHDTIKAADTVLIGLVERMENDGLSGADLPRLERLLALRAAALPQLHGLFIYGPDGRWIANSGFAAPVGGNNSHREYFAYHRTHGDQGPHIGPPIRSKSNNEWIITVSRRINEPDGSFGGVVLATIKMSYFGKYHERFNIGKNGAIFLANDKGILLIRRPFDDRLLGRDMSGLPLFVEHINISRAGTATIKSAIDGVTRVNSYRWLDDYPMVASTALSQDELLSEWRADAWRHGLAVAVIAGGLGLLGFRLILQIKLRIETEAELVKAREALEALNSKLELLAMQDGLTGLSNRRKFDAALKEEFSRATRDASALALIMIDVDCFKQYNDIYGHAAGDECLRAIGKIVGSGVGRPGDVAARYGGEELAVLLPHTDVAGAVAVAERIRDGIFHLQMNHKGNPTGFVTISAGVEAFAPVNNGYAPVELIEAADKWLYSAKAAGRNSVRAAVTAAT